MKNLDAIEINPREKVTICAIILHGLGADGRDLAPLADELAAAGRRFIFPHAPARPVAINGGMMMRAWHDIVDIRLDCAQDEKGARDSQRRINALIAREKRRGLTAGQIVLIGFSQGGAISLFCGLRQTESLGGIAALSSYLLLPETLADESPPCAKTTPIFIAHGELDPIVPPTLGRRAYENLSAMEFSRAQFHAYSDLPHAISSREIADLKMWLDSIHQPKAAERNK